MHSSHSFLQSKTVASFKKLVHDRCGVPPDEQRLIFGGKQLDDDKTLGDYSTLGNNATLFLVLRQPGGGNKTSRRSNKRHSDHQQQCDVHTEEQTEDCPICLEHTTTQLPCKHPICPNCLMDYAWTEAGCNKKTEIKCSLCSREWPLHIIQEVGNVLPEEIELLQASLSANYIAKDTNVSECPGCSNHCVRKDETTNRVYCRICSRRGKPHTYCWNCRRPWKNSGSNLHCGNAGCDTGSFLKILREAPLKTLEFLPKSVQVPSKRACPTCGIVIEHREGCKHMKCTGCNTEFCFLCLKKKVEGSLYCGSYNTVCTVAPVQDELPRRPG